MTQKVSCSSYHHNRRDIFRVYLKQTTRLATRNSSTGNIQWLDVRQKTHKAQSAALQELPGYSRPCLHRLRVRWKLITWNNLTVLLTERFGLNLYLFGTCFDSKGVCFAIPLLHKSRIEWKQPDHHTCMLLAYSILAVLMRGHNCTRS